MFTAPCDEPYDPAAILAGMGVVVLREWLRDTWGIWSPRHRVVILATGLTIVQERCVLAHEIEHINAGDASCGSGPVSMKAERRADRAAARKLIALSDICAASQWATSEHELAADLQVTPWVLRTRMDDLEGENRWLGTSKIAG